MKPDTSGVIEVNYGCHDCDFGDVGKNGVGLAAQHAEKYGHETWAEQTTSMEWNVGGNSTTGGEWE